MVILFSGFGYSSKAGEWLLVSRWLNEKPHWSVVRLIDSPDIEDIDPSLSLLEQAVSVFNGMTGKLLVVTRGVVVPVENADCQELKLNSSLKLLHSINHELTKAIDENQEVAWSYGVGFKYQKTPKGINYESDLQSFQISCFKKATDSVSRKNAIIELTKEMANLFEVEVKENKQSYENVWYQVLSDISFKEDLKISMLPSSNMLLISGSIDPPNYFGSDYSSEFTLSGALQGLLVVKIASSKQ